MMDVICQLLEAKKKVTEPPKKGEKGKVKSEEQALCFAEKEGDMEKVHGTQFASRPVGQTWSVPVHATPRSGPGAQECALSLQR